MAGAWVQSLVRELDPTCHNSEFLSCNWRFHMPQWRSKIPHTATKTQHSQINTNWGKSTCTNMERTYRRRVKSEKHSVHCTMSHTHTHTHTHTVYKSVCSLTPSCPALCNPVDCSPPGSSVHGISQARILEWVVTPSSSGSSQLRDRTCIRHVCK